MRFSIEGDVSFEPQSALLVNLVTDDCAELSMTSSRLLSELLSHRGDIVTRDELFHTVFESYGAKATNSNLNQYISTLRKSLSDLGIKKEVIITIPRVGFKIADDVRISFQPQEEEKKIDKKSDYFKVKKPAAHKLSFISTIIVSIAALIIIFHINHSKADFYYKNSHLTPLIHKKCTIYVPPGMSLKAARSLLNDAPFRAGTLDCSEKKEIYINQQQIRGALGINVSFSIIECNMSTTQCVSYHFRNKNNAQ